MELHQLQYLVAVADLGSFTRAGKRIHVSQPAVSAQVRRLEAELGVVLLDRTGGVTTPTAAGTAVLPWARAALSSAEAVRRAADDVTGLLRGAVHVGVVTATGHPVAAALLGTFHTTYPGVDVSLREATTPELVDGLHDGSLDLALVGTGPADLAGLVLQDVAADPVAAIVPTTHDWGARRRLRLADVLDRPLVCTPAGSGVRGVVAAGAAGIGRRADVAVEASSPVQAARLVAAGLGVGLLPASVIDAPGVADLVAVRVVAPTLSARIAWAWRDLEAANPAGRALLDLVRGDA